MSKLAPLRLTGFRSRRLRLILAVLFVFLPLVLLTAVSGGTDSRTPGILGLGVIVFVANLILVLMQGAHLGQVLALGARVLGGKQVPLLLWRQWLAACIKESCEMWVIFAVGGVVGILQSGAPLSAFTALAVLSVAMGLAVLRSLSAHGLLHAAWAWVISALLLLLLGGAAVQTTLAGSARWQDVLPSGLLALGVAVWPVVALMVLRRCRDRIPATLPISPLAMTVWGKHLLAYYKRYTPLAMSMPSWASQQPAYRRTLAWVMYGPVMLYVYAAGWGHAWGATVQFWQLGVFACFVLLFSHSLVCKDLHWRTLLAPGGLHRGQLATHIVVHTWWLTCASLGVVAFLICLFVWGVLGMPLALVLGEAALRFGTAPQELFFAASVGALLRAIGMHYWHFMAIVLTPLTFAGVWAAVDGMDIFLVPLYTLGPQHLGTLFLLSFAALWMANRLWTVEKLMQCAPKL